MRASIVSGRPGRLFGLLLLFLGGFACRAQADMLSLNPYTGGHDFTIQIAPSFDVDQSIPYSTGTLNGQLLNLFCVDIYDAVLPGTWNATTSNNDGVVLGDSVNNAGNIAWLLNNFANSTAPNSDQRLGLQALVWDLEYGFSLVAPGNGSSTTQATYDAYNNFLTQFTNAGSPSDALPTPNVYWITPNDSGNPGDYQGLAGNLVPAALPAPEPCSLLLFGLGTVGIIPLASFRKR